MISPTNLFKLSNVIFQLLSLFTRLASTTVYLLMVLIIGSLNIVRNEETRQTLVMQLAANAVGPALMFTTFGFCKSPRVTEKIPSFTKNHYFCSKLKYVMASDSVKNWLHLVCYLLYIPQ